MPAPLVPVVGGRYTIRYRITPDDAGHTVADALGYVVAVEPGHVEVATRRHGTVRIPRSAIVAVREVPAPPTRPGPQHATIAAADLQRLLAETWAPDSRAVLADGVIRPVATRGRLPQRGWLLGAQPGAGHRANSALAAGETGIPLPDALDAVAGWYAERHLGATVKVFTASATGSFDDVPAARAAQEAGWTAGSDQRILTAATGRLATLLPRAPGDAPEEIPHLEVRPVPHRDGLALALGSGRVDLVSSSRARMLTSADDQVFIEARSAETGVILGVVRLAMARRWAVMTDLMVAREARHRGIATALLHRAGVVARARRLESVALQVVDTNAAALTLYGGAGFALHHRERYLELGA